MQRTLSILYCEYIQNFTMGEKVIGWKIWGIQGEVIINPLVYVYQIVRGQKEKGTMAEKDISELVEICLSYAPHRKEKILDIIAENFPQFIDKINTYRILL
jgi:hypothetical protein